MDDDSIGQSFYAPPPPPGGDDDIVAHAEAAREPGTPAAAEEAVIAALREVFDPEIPVNIYDLGLIYDISFGDEGAIDVGMTLTAPGCPVADILPQQVADAVATAAGAGAVTVRLVWEPPWDQDMMSEAAKLELGMF